MYHPLAQTVMHSTPVVEDKSLGILRIVSDCTQAREANNLLYDLENKIYDPLIQNYRDKLDRTVSTFARTNDPRLPATLDTCRNNYKGQVKIKEEIGLAAHTSLTNERKTKLSELKTKLIAKDQTFLEEQNKLVAALKETAAQQIALLSTNLENHKKTRINLVTEEGDAIRINKKATLVSHRLSPFKVPKDGYCSDEDEQSPDEVDKFYTDQYLLSKMELTESIHLTVTKTERILETLNQANRLLQEIQAIRYQ